MNHTLSEKMTDIHMHLLPGLDDGAEDMNMTRMMLSQARQQGIFRIFATPHSDACTESPRAAFERLTKNMQTAYADMELFLGCEVACEERNLPQVLAALDSGQYPTMNNTSYVLIEFSRYVEPEGTFPCVRSLVERGYIPIIAHMERYQNLRHQMELVDRLKEMGALIQVNASSLYSAYSQFDPEETSVQNWARQLVQERKATFLATDAHNSYHRPPYAEEGLAWLYENTDPDYADAIAWENAQTLLIPHPKKEESL